MAISVVAITHGPIVRARSPGEGVVTHGRRDDAPTINTRAGHVYINAPKYITVTFARRSTAVERRIATTIVGVFVRTRAPSSLLVD